MAEDGEVIDNPAMHRFELQIGDEVATGYYAFEHGRVVFTHTEVAFCPSRAGLRVQARARRSRGMRVIAKCPFMATYALKHPGYIVTRSARSSAPIASTSAHRVRFVYFRA